MTAELEPAEFTRFEIRFGDAGAERTAGVLPDLVSLPGPASFVPAKKRAAV